MRYFFVFQNKTFLQEARGGFLWAPQGAFCHWKNMRNIQRGDMIFHSFHKQITTVSIATNDCYEAIQPTELQAEKLWEDNGWRVDCQYHFMEAPIVTSDYMTDLLKLQPTKYAPFNRCGRGNTGYLFNCTQAMAEFLLSKLAIKNADVVQKIEIQGNL